MTSRRDFLSLVAGSVALPGLAAAQAQVPARKVALYANIGAELMHFEVDAATATLTRRDSVTLPAAVQYCWPHASRGTLYAATSGPTPRYGKPVVEHHVSALRINPASGALTKHGEAIMLPAAPVHLTIDGPSQHLLVAFYNPSALRVYRINADFTPGGEVKQDNIDAGVFAHQVRVTPNNRHVILVARGNEATPKRPEDPGGLKLFDYKDGVLSNGTDIAPNAGRGYGPRHLDFHPTQPWMYVSVETQNKLHMHRLQTGKPLAGVVYAKETLAEPNNIRSRQAAGTVHVHPNGRFVYGANRSQDVAEFLGKRVYRGGENNIAVYAIDQKTGEPTPIQHIETQAIHPRTFHIDPSGRMLVAQHNLPVDVRDGSGVRTLPAGLSTFRIGADGKLTFVRKYDFDVGSSTMFWMGMVEL